MAPGDVCHGPRGSLAGLGPVALEYRSCHWPGGSAGSPQCVRPMGCWFFPVPRPPYVCAVSWATWLLFTGVPAWFVVLRVRCPRPIGSCSPVCPLGVLSCVCGVLGHLAPVHRCARWVCCVACVVSLATWLLFTGAPARCVALRVRCPGPLVSCSSVCPLGVLCCVCGVLGHLAPVNRCARPVCCFACAVSCTSWLLFTCVPARCVVLRVRCPGPLRSCSPVRPLGGLLCVCGVLGLFAPVHQCARPVCCVACAVSWATWLLFTGAPAGCVVLCGRCPWPLGSRSPVRPLGVLCCVCGVLGFFYFSFFPGCGCVPMPVLVSAWVSWGTGVGWLLRSGFPVCAPAPRLPVPRALVRGVLTAGGWRQWWRGACVGVRGSWVVPGWRWPGVGVRVGVFMAWADGVVGSVGVAGLCGCRVCVRRRRGGLGWGTVGDAMGGGDAGDAYVGGAVGVETGWCR